MHITYGSVIHPILSMAIALANNIGCSNLPDYDVQLIIEPTPAVQMLKDYHRDPVTRLCNAECRRQFYEARTNTIAVSHSAVLTHREVPSLILR